MPTVGGKLPDVEQWRGKSIWKSKPVTFQSDWIDVVMLQRFQILWLQEVLDLWLSSFGFVN